MNMHTQQTKRESGELVAKDDALIIKAVREKSREVDFVASTGDLDSHGDIIDQGSWDLSHFKQNPIVLYGHDAKELPIGMCTSVGVVNGQLECTIRFAKTQRADEVLDLVRDDVLRAVSVGFTPVNGGYEIVNGKEAWVWRNAILKEISVVPIGSNPHALAKALVLSSKGDRTRAITEAVTAGLLQEGERDEWAKFPEELFRSLLSKRRLPHTLHSNAATRGAEPTPEQIRKATISHGIDAMNALRKSSEAGLDRGAAEVAGVLAAQEAERERLAESRRRKASGELTPKEEQERKVRGAFAALGNESDGDPRIGPAGHLHTNHDPIAAIEHKRAEGERQRKDQARIAKREYTDDSERAIVEGANAMNEIGGAE